MKNQDLIAKVRAGLRDPRYKLTVLADIAGTTPLTFRNIRDGVSANPNTAILKAVLKAIKGDGQ